jgi:hypothetical protein
MPRLKDIDKILPDETTTGIFSLDSKPTSDAAKSTSHVSIINLRRNNAFQYLKLQIDFDIQGLERKVDPYDKFKINPFDPDTIDITINFKGPSLYKKRVPAFWSITYQRKEASDDPTGFTINRFRNEDFINIADPEFMQEKYPDSRFPDPTPWHVRFAPPHIGSWSYDFRIILNKGTASEQVSFFPGGTFQVFPTNNKGYVKTYNAERNFRFNTDRSIFFPIGTHAVWGGYPTYNRFIYLYTRDMIDHLSKFKGNHIRTFLNRDKFHVESEVLNRYVYGDAQRRAMDLDDIVEYAREKNVYLQLVLEERLDFTLEGHPDHPKEFNPWKERNPYSKINSVPEDFWSNPLSAKVYKKKLRYILARWGYSTSIFAFEFMNEVTLAFDYDQFQGGDLSDKVSNWVNDMIEYCKVELQDEHLYTISTTDRRSEFPHNTFGPSVYTSPDFVQKMNIDFYTDHLYLTSEFQDYRINYLANRAKHRYHNKPYIIGEFGLQNITDRSQYFKDGEKLCDSINYVYTDHFLSKPVKITNLYDANEIHNALFASFLSGCSGTAAFWEDFRHPGWGGQLSNIEPFVRFIEGEDLNLANCIPIRNECPINVAFIDPDKKHFNVPGEIPIGWSRNQFLEELLPKSIFNIDIEASNAKAEVFALKYTNGISKHKIIGWVRNRNNWWYNLPHHGDSNSINNANCKNLSPHVTPINKLKIKIKNLTCNGTYRIDFYSVYYDRALVSGGIAENGGIIGSVTAHSHCGELSFDVPGDLVVLTKDNAPCAPDYGFKINLISKGWGYGTIGTRFPQISGIQPIAVLGDGTQIAFRGNDGSLQCYYRTNPDVYDWKHAVLGPAGSNGVMPGGAITRGALSGQIYYHGANNRLQVVYWNHTHWAWGHLTDWSNTSQNVGGDIGSNATGGKVFYRGADGHLHFYMYNSGWHHSIYHLPRNHRPAPNANLSVTANGNIVVFKTVDGSLAFIWYDHATGRYQTGIRSMDRVADWVRINNEGNVVFYRGVDGRLYQVFYEGSAWYSRIISTSWGAVTFNGSFDISPNSTKDNAQIYFRGADEYVNVVHVWDGNWIQNPIISCSQPASYKCGVGGYIRYAGGTLFFEGQKGRGRGYEKFVRAYYYGKCDIETI